jgi:hypothetical protein
MVAAGIAIGCVVFVTIGQSSSRRSHSHRRMDQIVARRVTTSTRPVGRETERRLSPPINLAQPVIGGVQVGSVSQAQTMVDFPIPQPNVTVAGPRSLTATWVNPAANAVALVYGNGDIAVMMGPAQYTDPATAYSNMIASNNATASVEQIAGYSALVISPNTDASQSNPAWIQTDIHGIDVNIASFADGTGALSQVAQSMLGSSAQAARSAGARRDRSERRSGWIGGSVGVAGERGRGAAGTPVVVRVFTSSDRAIGMDYLHGSVRRFHFKVPAGTYTVEIDSALAHPVTCERATARVRALQTSDIAFRRECSAP